MSIQQGSFSVTRYRVIGRKKNLKLAELNQEFGRFRLKPFRLRPSRRELHFGWDFPSQVLGMPVPHEAWDLSDCQADEGLWLRVRVEKRKLSTQLLQVVTQSRIDSEQRKRQGKPIGRKQQKSILDEVREELLHQSLPNLSYFEAFWQDQADQIYLFTTSKSSCAIFEELFRETFGKPLDLSLVKLAPPLLGLTQDEWRGKNGASQRISLLEKAVPESLVSAEQ
ncbi:MAG: recombination-associated protein RdgC [Oligoflexus sp.]